MSDKNISEHFDNLSDDAKSYIKSEIKYIKLDAYKKLIKATASLLKFIVNSGLVIMVFTFLSIGLAILIGYYIGYYSAGFFILAGVYLILLLLMLIFGKPFIERKVLRIYNKIFEDI